MKNEELLIYGKNSVIEYLDSGKRPIKLYLRNKVKKDRKISYILKECNRNNIYIQYINEYELGSLTKNGNHQGVILVVEKAKNIDIIEIEELMEKLESKEKCCVALLDSIQDTHNMGAIIRSAEFFGIDAVIIPSKNTAPINETVYKTSSGAVEYIDIARVNNLKYAMELLKQHGFWIYGTYIDEGKDLKDVKFDRKTALILGSEGKGLKKSIKENCDFLIFIIRLGNIESLNVSVTSGIMFYEYSKQHF